VSFFYNVSHPPFFDPHVCVCFSLFFLHLTQPAVAIACNPVLFTLPTTTTNSDNNENSTTQNDDNQENQQPSTTTTTTTTTNTTPFSSSVLPYRCIIAVLTHDSILIYDTVHSTPLAIFRGLHYANLTHAVWSADGHSLVVSSSDGYVSLLRFEKGELGQVYHHQQQRPSSTLSSSTTSTTSSTTTTANSVVDVHPEQPDQKMVPMSSTSASTTTTTATTPSLPVIPPGEHGTTTVIEGRPIKKMKRITPVCITKRKSSSILCKEEEEEEEEDNNHDETKNHHLPPVIPPGTTCTSRTTGGGTTGIPVVTVPSVQDLSLSSVVEPKKKKRIQPILLSSSSS
jgi:hypothetical protein